MLHHHMVVGEFGYATTPDWQTTIANPLLRADIEAAAARRVADRLTSAATLATRLSTLEQREAAEAARLRAEAEDRERREAEEARRRRRPYIVALRVMAAVTIVALGLGALNAFRQRDQAIAETHRIRQTADVLESTVSALATGLANGLRDRPGLSVSALEDVLGQAQAALETMSKLAPDRRLKQLQAVMLTEFAHTYLRRGDTTKAEQAVLEAISQQHRLMALYPSDLSIKEDLRDSERWRGEIAMARRDMSTALSAYRSALNWAETVAKVNPDNAPAQLKLGHAITHVGHALSELGRMDEALATDKRAVAALERGLAQRPADAEWASALSVAEEQVGDVLDARGDHRGALEAYRRQLALLEGASAQDPGNTRYSRNLAIAMSEVGGELGSLHDNAGALESYQRALQITRSLTCSDPTNTEWARDIAVDVVEIGDTDVALRKFGDAISMYAEGDRVLARLATADPGNGQLQDDLIITEKNLAFCLGETNALADGRAHFRRALDILQHVSNARQNDTEVVAIARELREKTASAVRLACDQAWHCRELP